MRGRADTLVILRGYQRDLGPVDLGKQIAPGDTVVLVGSGGPFERSRDDFLRIGNDMREGSDADVVPDLAQLVQGGGMESGRGDLACNAERCQSLPHLIGGLHRKRHRERPARIPLAFGAGIGDAPCDGARLARTGTGNDANRAVKGRGGRALGVVKPLKLGLRIPGVHICHSASRTR